MVTIDSLDELLNYIEDKGISAHRLARVSGYCRSHIRNIIEGDSEPSPECLEILIEAALDIGEQVTFNRREMQAIKDALIYEDLKKSSMTDREWKDFLGKLS
jgi:transcriptional regulator with XRE-family HTH domain